MSRFSMALISFVFLCLAGCGSGNGQDDTGSGLDVTVEADGETTVDEDAGIATDGAETAPDPGSDAQSDTVEGPLDDVAVAVDATANDDAASDTGPASDSVQEGGDTAGAEDAGPSGADDASTCVPACEGMECGDDGCGGSCGDCQGDGMACQAGACVAADFCDGLSFEGCCDGSVLHYCLDGVVEFFDCGEAGCGWSGVAGYQCGSTDEGPEEFPAACTFECEASCDGKACGNDGCGGSCGACTDGETCDGGVCVAVSPCEVCPEGMTCGAPGLDDHCSVSPCAADVNGETECLDSGHMTWCEDGVQLAYDCEGQSGGTQSCGWSDESNSYTCVDVASGQPSSCAGVCGDGPASGDCFCDAGCAVFDDCCDDACEFCPEEMGAALCSGEGSCTNEADLALIASSDPTVMTTEALVDCIAATDTDLEGCLADALAGAGLSVGCSACYVGRTVCEMTACSDECAGDPTTDTCETCLDAACGVVFATCSGLE